MRGRPIPPPPTGSSAVAAAYRVLADVERRRDYDERRAHGLAPVAAAERPVATTQAAAPPSRRGARWAIAGGIACLVLGVAATALIISLQRHDADLRSRGTPTTATVVLDGTERRLEFTTATVKPSTHLSRCAPARERSRWVRRCRSATTPITRPR